LVIVEVRNRQERRKLKAILYYYGIKDLALRVVITDTRIPALRERYEELRLVEEDGKYRLERI